MAAEGLQNRSKMSTLCHNCAISFHAIASFRAFTRSAENQLPLWVSKMKDEYVGLRKVSDEMKRLFHPANCLS